MSSCFLLGPSYLIIEKLIFFSPTHIFSYCYRQSISHKIPSFVYSVCWNSFPLCECVHVCVCMCARVCVCVCECACMAFWNQSKKKGCRKGDLIHRFVEKCKCNLNSLWVLCLAFRTVKKMKKWIYEEEFLPCVPYIHFSLGEIFLQVKK